MELLLALDLPPGSRQASKLSVCAEWREQQKRGGARREEGEDLTKLVRTGEVFSKPVNPTKL